MIHSVTSDRWNVIFEGEIHPWEWTWIVQSHSRPKIAHTVTIDFNEGYVTCTCEHFIYRLAKHWPKLFGGCIHVDDVCLEAARILEQKGDL